MASERNWNQITFIDFNNIEQCTTVWPSWTTRWPYEFSALKSLLAELLVKPTTATQIVLKEERGSVYYRISHDELLGHLGGIWIRDYGVWSELSVEPPVQPPRRPWTDDEIAIYNMKEGREEQLMHIAATEQRIIEDWKLVFDAMLSLYVQSVSTFAGGFVLHCQRHKLVPERQSDAFNTLGNGGGRPPQLHDEKVYRIAMALLAEELKEKDSPKLSYPQIIIKIKFQPRVVRKKDNPASDLALLKNAISDLKRLQESDKAEERALLNRATELAEQHKRDNPRLNR